ncbi:hypothetical protein V3C99_005484 [Haemonchus contortus]
MPLFPQVVIPADKLPTKIPFIEIPHLENTIEFRAQSKQVTNQLLTGAYYEVDVANVRPSPADQFHPVKIPHVYKDIRPVLHQVVATGWGADVILEAEDFFIMGIDRSDLHCFTFDQYSIDMITGGRGFNKALLSIKEFVWV